MLFRIARFLPYILVIYLVLPIISAFMLLSSVSLIDFFKLSNAMFISIASAFVTTIISALFGVPLAYMLARGESRVNYVVEALVISPIVLPPLATGLFLLSIFSPAGFIGNLANGSGFHITRTFFAVVLAQTAVASPFTVMSAKAAFEGVDVKLEFASRLMGAGRLKTFLMVSLPLAKKGIVAGLLMTFVRAVGEFGATFMLAYFPKTLPIYLYTSYLRGGIGEAVPAAIVLWLIGMVVFILMRATGDELAGTGRSG